MRTICLSPSISSLFSPYHSLSGFLPALIIYASFPISLLPLSPPHIFTVSLSLSFNRILFQSHSLTLATHSRVRSGTRVSYEHSSRGNHRYCARSADFRSAFVQTNDVGGKTRTPFVVKSLRPTSTRVALRIIKIPLDRGGRHGEELFRSLGTRQSNSEGAIRGESRRKREADPYRNRAIGDFDKHSRRTGAGNRRGGAYARVATATAAAPPSLVRSSRLAVTNNTRSFGQNRCILQRRQIGLYVYE